MTTTSLESLHPNARVCVQNVRRPFRPYGEQSWHNERCGKPTEFVLMDDQGQVLGTCCKRCVPKTAPLANLEFVSLVRVGE